MRVTGGNLKGRAIGTGFASHVRPSTDRMRESMFNSLQHQIGIQHAHILDLFSGSGIIALEFLSRNAEKVTSVDLDRKNILFQKNTKTQFNLPNWEILSGNALKLPFELDLHFDIIFADPPYHMADLQSMPLTLLPLLDPNNPDAVLIFEHKPQLVFPENCSPFQQKDYGSSVLSYFQRNH